MLETKGRYLQIAFNGSLSSVYSILPLIPRSERILIEAGTPFIKKEGMNGIRAIAALWKGMIVADMKTADGAAEEVYMAHSAGATAATVLGSAPKETLDIFIQSCKSCRMTSMIDMIGVEEPMRVLTNLKSPPDVVILHKARDEETTKGKTIPYKQINKIKSKYDTLISAAGGVDLREAESAVFNGANIVVVNIVSDSIHRGISESEDILDIAKKFLEVVE